MRMSNIKTLQSGIVWMLYVESLQNLAV